VVKIGIWSNSEFDRTKLEFQFRPDKIRILVLTRFFWSEFEYQFCPVKIGNLARQNWNFNPDQKFYGQNWNFNFVQSKLEFDPRENIRNTYFRNIGYGEKQIGKSISK
jgi:hypothetical protein